MVFAGEWQLDCGAFGDAHRGGVGEPPIADVLGARSEIAESGLVEELTHRQPALRSGDTLVGVRVQRLERSRERSRTANTTSAISSTQARRRRSTESITATSEPVLTPRNQHADREQRERWPAQ